MKTKRTITKSETGEQTIDYVVRKCWLGQMLIARSGRGLCALFFGDDPQPLVEDLQRRFAGKNITENAEGMSALAEEVLRALDDPHYRFKATLDLVGTAFQREVWQALRGIAAGTTISYSELAARVGRPDAVRAVGTACGANPISLIVPCHRVVSLSGALTGYRWGIERKRKLIAFEQKARRTKRG